MKRPAAKGGRNRSGGDDEALWSLAAQSIEPLKKRKGRFHPAADAAAAVPARQDKKEKPPPGSVAPAKSPPAGVSQASKKSTAPPPIADFDRRKARKLKIGAVEIEARVDLHGMRQDEAHAALFAFLHRCHNKGKRWVLVITGKGRSVSQQPDAPFDMSSQRDRGVLRRNVPRWLEEPELRRIVVSYAEAALAHGGEGALYVHMRAKHRSGV